MRKTFPQTVKAAKEKLLDYQPEATIPIPRVSHVVFSSDESSLIIAAEEGGGLAIYDVNALLNGGKEAAFSVSTNGAAIRHLLPNPAKDRSHIYGVILVDGSFLMADLQQRQLVNGPNGSSVFRNGVHSACWSKLGKQIVLGLEDGTAVQINPEGAPMAQIPAPPGLSEGLALTNIYWLENLDYITIHTHLPNPNGEPNDELVCHLVHREKETGNCSYHAFGDPTFSRSDDRLPPNISIERLRDWPPNMDDMLFLTSSIASDIGMLTRSKVPLDPDNIDPEKIKHIYTVTTPMEEGRRAALPATVGSDEDFSPCAIGQALDLSVTEKVLRPIPSQTDIMEESPTPLPALYVLNNEGVLAVWYVIYNSAVLDGVAYPGMTKLGGSATDPPQASNMFGGANNTTPAPQTAPAPAPAPARKPAQPLFGQSSAPGFGGTSALGKMQSPWGAPPAASSPGAAQPVFGQNSKPAFGGSSAAPPAVSSPGAAAPSFGKPSFGSGFGQTGGMGAKASPWGSGTPLQSPGTASSGQSTLFGGNASAASPFSSFKPAGGDDKAASSPFGAFAKPADGKPAPSPFAGFGSGTAGNNSGLGSPFSSFGKPSGNENNPAGSAFSSFASAGKTESPFSSFNAKKEDKPSSVFGSGPPAAEQKAPGMPADPSFGSTVTLSSNTGSFGSASTVGQTPALGQGSFGQSSGQQGQQGSGLSGFGGFKMTSTFKGDGTAKDDLPKPKDAGSSLFGANFGSSLFGKKQDEPSTPIKTEPDTEGPKLGDIPEASTTPASPPKQPKPQGEAAPLPPDFTTMKPKENAPPPVPDDAPLPPDFTSVKPSTGEGADVPIAGSPPLDVGDEKFSASGSDNGEEEGPPEDDEEEEWSEEGEDDQEEDDEEDGEEDDEEEDGDEEYTVENPEQLSAFEARISPASPKREQQQESTTPETDKKTSYTPAGFPQPKTTFAPPTRSQDSPRSPSPVRASQISRPPQQQQQQPPPPTFGKISVPPPQHVERPVSRQKAPTPQPQPTPAQLEDEEDARIKAVLDTPAEPTRDIPEFVAHQDYSGGSTKEGFVGQMEKIYRDVNSMIDTLGMNARSLQAFVDGHKQVRDTSSPRSRNDLEDGDAWALDESDELRALIDGLDNGLEKGRVEDPTGKIADLQDEEKELIKLGRTTGDLRRQLATRTDPAQRAAQQNAPLPPETAAQQAELRQSVQRLQSLLAQAEESIGLLRADLASLPSTNASSKNVPTVEAVTNTILKLTAMVEQRSGDVDLLESQIKRLPRGLASLKLNDDYEDDLVGAMRGSKLLTASTTANGSPRASTTQRPRMAANGDPLGMSGMFSTRTPPGLRQSGMFSPGASALGRSTTSAGGSARKKMQDVSAEEAEEWLRKREARRRVVGNLKEKVEGRGVRVVRFER